MTGSAYINSLDIYVDDTDFTDQVIGELEDLLYAAFNYHDDTYQVINMESLLDTMNTMMSLMSGLLGMCLLFLLAYLGAETAASAMNILLYQLLWQVPNLLITGVLGKS